MILFASRFSGGPLSLVRAMIYSLRWAAFLWTINSIPCTFGMAVNERSGVCCPQLCVLCLSTVGGQLENWLYFSITASVTLKYNGVPIKWASFITVMWSPVLVGQNYWPVLNSHRYIGFSGYVVG